MKVDSLVKNTLKAKNDLLNNTLKVKNDLLGGLNKAAYGLITAFKAHPNGSFRFWVELDGMLVAGFTEVSGLQVETEVEEYQEGGVNNFVHRLPKVTKYSNLVLRRGITSSTALWDWHKNVVEGNFERKNGAVILLNQNGLELWRWNFYDSYPVKWNGPELKSSSSEVAIESLELTHNGLKGVASVATGLLNY